MASSEGTMILEFNQYYKSGKTPFITYADLEPLMERNDGFRKYSGYSSTVKVSEHNPSGFPMSTISSFKYIENKHDIYRDKDCMKRFC